MKTWRAWVAWLVPVLVLVSLGSAAPENNPILPPTSWEGYGVDWMYRSLRVGTNNRDSLLENGWALIDTLEAGLVLADSTVFAFLGADTLIVNNFAAIDTIIFTSRVPRDTLANRRILSLADSVYAQSQAVGVVYGTVGGTWVQQLSAYVRVEPGDTASVYWGIYVGAPMDSVLLPESPGSYLMPRGLSDTLLVVDTVWTKYNWTLPDPVYLHLPLSYAFYAAGNIDWWLAGMNHDAAPGAGEVIYGMEFVPFPTLAWQTNGIDPIVQFMCDSTVRQDSMVCAYDPRDRRYSMYLDEASAYLFQTRVLGTDYLFSPSGTWVTNLSNFISYGTNLMGLITADSIATTDLRVLDDAVVDSMLAVGDSAYFNDQVYIDGILYADSIDGHSPIYMMSDVLLDSAFYVADSVALNYTGGGTWVGGTLTADSSLSVADSSWFSDDLYVGYDLSAEYGMFRTSAAVDSVLWVGDSTFILLDSAFFYANVTVDSTLIADSISVRAIAVDTLYGSSPITIMDSLVVGGAVTTLGSLTTAAKILELFDGRLATYQWEGTIDIDSIKTGVTNDTLDVKVFTLPAKARILAIFVDVSEGFDDGAGAIDSALVQVGSNATTYDNLLSLTSCLTPGCIGDEAGEVAWTSVQGGTVLSWSGTTDIYIKLIISAGEQIRSLTTGLANLIVLYHRM